MAMTFFADEEEVVLFEVCCIFHFTEDNFSKFLEDKYVIGILDSSTNFDIF